MLIDLQLCRTASLSPCRPFALLPHMHVPLKRKKYKFTSIAICIISNNYSYLLIVFIWNIFKEDHVFCVLPYFPI